MRLLVKKGHVIDPKTQRDGVMDILIADGVIEKIAPDLDAAADRTIDANGCVVAPALVDIHTHVGEPGYEQRETLSSFGEAAVRGGVGTAVLMPDTDPPRQGAADIRATLDWSAALPCKIHVAACLTKDRNGAEPTEWGELVAAGAVALGDVKPLQDSGLVRRALTYLRNWGTPLLADCIDLGLAQGASGREGYHGTMFGLRGMPAAAEECAVSREVILARLAEGRLHIQRVSTQGGVELIARAKAEGLNVTAEVSWLHLLKTDAALEHYDTSLKVWPPLGNEADREALIEAVRSGVIDSIVSDHTPYALEEKDVEFDAAPWGAAGIEHALPALWSELVAPGHLSELTLIERLTAGPADAMGLQFAGLDVGAPADVVVVDPQSSWRVEREGLASQAANHPYVGAELSARVRATIVDGVVRYEDK